MMGGILKRWARIAGFTLIEIAIVLVVIGVIMAGSLVGLKPVVENGRTSTTTSKLKRVELALQAYVMQNGCLPCPADGTLASDTDLNAGWSHSDTDYYGPNGPSSRPCTAPGGSACNQNGGGGAAAHPVGVVPWKTLGLRESDILDAWNSRISYAVDSSLTVTVNGSMYRTTPTSYPAGTLSVTNYNATQTQTTAAAYVLVSHGRDRAGAFAANGSLQTTGTTYVVGNPQGANMPANNVAPAGSPNTSNTAFRQDTLRLISGAATYFDDIVVYRTAPNMIQDCGPNGCGNPSG